MSPTSKKSEPRDKAGTVAPSAVKVKSGLPEVQAGDKRARYYVGTLPSCPVQNVTVGGISFPRFRGNPTFDDRGRPDRELDFGIFIDLAEAEVSFVQKAVSTRVLRLLGKEPEPGKDDPERTPSRRRAAIYPIDGKNYHHREGDQPLGRFLYMHRVDAMTAEQMQSFPPEAMEEE